MIIKSDNKEVREVALSIQNLGKVLEADIERELLRAGADVVVTVLHRVKREGKDSNGGILDTRSVNRSGRYSEYWANKRKKKGLQTARVDLNYTGEMLLSYNLTERSKRMVGVGFLNDESNEKSEYLEEYYGSDIFTPSDQEEDEILDDAMMRIEQLIDKL